MTMTDKQLVEWHAALRKRGFDPAFVDNVHQEAIAHGKAHGCTCEPFVHLMFKKPEIFASMTHADDCPLGGPHELLDTIKLDDAGRPPLN